MYYIILLICTGLRIHWCKSAREDTWKAGLGGETSSCIRQIPSNRYCNFVCVRCLWILMVIHTGMCNCANVKWSVFAQKLVHASRSQEMHWFFFSIRIKRNVTISVVQGTGLEIWISSPALSNSCSGSLWFNSSTVLVHIANWHCLTCQLGFFIHWICLSSCLLWNYFGGLTGS